MELNFFIMFWELKRFLTHKISRILIFIGWYLRVAKGLCMIYDIKKGQKLDRGV